MDKKARDTVEKIFKVEYEELTEQEKHVAHHITERTPISTNIVQDYSERSTFGQKMADKVASFGDPGYLSHSSWAWWLYGFF